jgi:hypothetical protein
MKTAQIKQLLEKLKELSMQHTSNRSLWEVIVAVEKSFEMVLQQRKLI